MALFSGCKYDYMARHSSVRACGLFGNITIVGETLVNSYGASVLTGRIGDVHYALLTGAKIRWEIHVTI